MTNTRELKFHSQVYQLASVIDEEIEAYSGFTEVDWTDEEIIGNLFKPSKVSILHHYIFGNISAYFNEYYSSSDLDFIKEIELISLEQVLENYELDFYPWTQFCMAMSSLIGDVDEHFEILFAKWLEVNDGPMHSLREEFTNEIFHLLFANRRLLLKFNRGVAKYIDANDVAIPKEFLTPSNKIKRASYLPKWLKNAVYCRDKGRCVVCQCDLSGILSVDRTLHYDHIVPLNLSGTNDASNFQLLCESCNLEKSGTRIITGNRYSTWWDYDKY